MGIMSNYVRPEITEMNMTPSKTENPDVHWNQYSHNALSHAHNGDWILARNEYRKMGRLAFEEGWPGQALRLYLYVCALDLNGIRNRSEFPGGILGGSPTFDAKLGFLAPDVVADIALIVEKTGTDMEDLRKCFFAIAPVKSLPLPAVRSWPVLAHAIQQRMNSREQFRSSLEVQKEGMRDEGNNASLSSPVAPHEFSLGLFKSLFSRLRWPKSRNGEHAGNKGK
jgi:hypothetical protein